MDSTFLGLIVGAQKRFSRLAGKSRGTSSTIVLIGVNEPCKSLLRTIGVLGMVELTDSKATFPEDLARLSGEARTSARFLLDAHAELSSLSDDNRKRFDTLTNILKKAADAEEKKDT